MALAALVVCWLRRLPVMFACISLYWLRLLALSQRRANSKRRHAQQKQAPKNTNTHQTGFEQLLQMLHFCSAVQASDHGCHGKARPHRLWWSSSPLCPTSSAKHRRCQYMLSTRACLRWPEILVKGYCSYYGICGLSRLLQAHAVLGTFAHCRCFLLLEA